MQAASSQVLVLVTGSGRSGTSSLAGSLKRLGLHIPEPEVPASETNPRGFYEPQWVIDFHKGYLKELAMHNIDSRPTAVGLVEELVAGGEPEQRLTAWLADLPRDRQICVKDPHAYWFGDVWKAACASSDLDLRWLTALRHPAEVVGSRDIAYLQDRDESLRLVKETSNIAGWLHAALLSERQGRGGLRSFVRYDDLLADWRTALTTVRDQLELTYEGDLGPGHPVDDFLEPSMRKSQLTWADLRLPDWLRDLADEAWQILTRMVAQPADEAGEARLDEIHDEYARRYAESVAFTFDHTQGENAMAARQARSAQRDKIQELRGRIQKLRGELGR
jgi:hypothetical protein